MQRHNQPFVGVVSLVAGVAALSLAGHAHAFEPSTSAAAQQMREEHRKAPPGCRVLDLGEGFNHVQECSPPRPLDVQIREEMDAARREMKKGGR
jgi:hypothetical protein